MFQSHTTHWIFELLKKNLEVQRARPVTRDRVPDTTEWGASRVVRGARCVVGGARLCTRHPLTPPLALWSAQLDQSEASITHGTLDIRTFLKKPRSSQHVVRRGWCAPMHSTPATPDTWR